MMKMIGNTKKVKIIHRSVHSGGLAHDQQGRRAAEFPLLT